MARTIEDVAMLFEVMAGYDDGDPVSAPVKVSNQYSVTSTQKKLATDNWIPATAVGFFEDDTRTPVSEETREAVRSAALMLMSCGFHVDAFHPEGLEEARQSWWDFFGIAGGMMLEPMIAEATIREATQRGGESIISPILREFRGWCQATPPHTGDSLLAAWLGRDAIREKILLQMRKFPVLVCPTAAIPAFSHGEREWQVEGQTVKYLDAWSYCEWFNLLGFPAAVVPMGYSKTGLPIGVQIVGRSWEDELVLAVAGLLERERGVFRAPQLT
jgi:Asp-tRNA(Asn)/Glu-tRNA(Gln) amidotransferase A subunit family amidase